MQHCGHYIIPKMILNIPRILGLNLFSFLPLTIIFINVLCLNISMFLNTPTVKSSLPSCCLPNERQRQNKTVPSKPNLNTDRHQCQLDSIPVVSVLRRRIAHKAVLIRVLPVDKDGYRPSKDCLADVTALSTPEIESHASIVTLTKWLMVTAELPLMRSEGSKGPDTERGELGSTGYFWDHWLFLLTYNYLFVNHFLIFMFQSITNAFLCF